METVYRTLDGKIFTEAADAEQHEQEILEKVKMWDWNENPTTDTSHARVIHLVEPGSGAIFKAMVAANSEEYDLIADDIMDDEDYGWFYWDEYDERYRYIDKEIVDILIAANHQI